MFNKTAPWALYTSSGLTLFYVKYNNNNNNNNNNDDDDDDDDDDNDDNNNNKNNNNMTRRVGITELIIAESFS